MLVSLVVVRSSNQVNVIYDDKKIQEELFNDVLCIPTETCKHLVKIPKTGLFRGLLNSEAVAPCNYASPRYTTRKKDGTFLKKINMSCICFIYSNGCQLITVLKYYRRFVASLSEMT